MGCQSLVTVPVLEDVNMGARHPLAPNWPWPCLEGLFTDLFAGISCINKIRSGKCLKLASTPSVPEPFWYTLITLHWLLEIL
jgi:hypothetical protein